MKKTLLLAACMVSLAGLMACTHANEKKDSSRPSDTQPAAGSPVASPANDDTAIEAKPADEDEPSDYYGYLEAAPLRWPQKSIKVPDGGSRPDIVQLVQAFDAAWPGYVMHLDEGLRSGNVETLVDKDFESKIIIDRKSGYAGYTCGLCDDFSAFASCLWRMSNGHTLFAFQWGHYNAEPYTFTAFYDYDPQTQTLTPDLKTAQAMDLRPHASIELPRKGTSITSGATDDYPGESKWNGMIFSTKINTSGIGCVHPEVKYALGDMETDTDDKGNVRMVSLTCEMEEEGDKYSRPVYFTLPKPVPESEFTYGEVTYTDINFDGKDDMMVHLGYVDGNKQLPLYGIVLAGYPSEFLSTNTETLIAPSFDSSTKTVTCKTRDGKTLKCAWLRECLTCLSEQ